MSAVTSPKSGYCQCGCGQRTPVARKTRNRIEHKKGQPIPFINGHNRRKRDRYRVEDRGYKTLCHIWLLSKSKWGYGLEAVGHSQRGAHVMAYERTYGPVPKGRELDHLCRQRDCVRPDHLEPVMPAINVQRGDRARLTPREVHVIRRMLNNGQRQTEIAPYFDVCAGTIGAIARGETWRNV